MNEKIYKKKDKLIIEIPFTQDIYDCWGDPRDKPVGQKDNIIALVEENPKCSSPDMGFCYRIDMSYKGKSDQWTDFFFKWFGEQKEFEKLCSKLKIDTVYC